MFDYYGHYGYTLNPLFLTTSNLLETRRRCTYVLYVIWPEKNIIDFYWWLTRLQQKSKIFFDHSLNTIKEQNHSSVYTWASKPENLSLETFCEQQKGQTSLCISETAQRLCYWLIGKYIWACYKRNFNFVASVCGCAGCIGYDLVGNPEDRLSCDEAHIILWWDMILSFLLFFSHYEIWVLSTSVRVINLREK